MIGKQLPMLIQGGMGVGVSTWQLARAVSLTGNLGVVSGTGLDTVLARRLQLGDPGGYLRAAFDGFPVPAIAERVWNRYFRKGGKGPREPFKSKPIPVAKAGSALTELVVLANFAEVFLAKRGHSGQVGINLMVKIQAPTLASLFGSMLAGVDAVLMGAGIPRDIPSALESLAALKRTRLPIHVTGASAEDKFEVEFDPSPFLSSTAALSKPTFLPIVSSDTLATNLARRGGVDGFVVEHHTAGGHNAPPRGPLSLDSNGQPVYGVRDEPDCSVLRELGLPFWMAGSYGSPQGLERALELGAAGIQAGTIFAFCEESGIAESLKHQVIKDVRSHSVKVFTDPSASPTSFPFKVLCAARTLSDASVYERRERICDLGYLREMYRKPNGTIGYRCPGEPVEDFVEKGGRAEETVGRMCVCNALLATIGLGQVRKNQIEPALITAGDAVEQLGDLLPEGRDSYSAAEAVAYVLNGRHGK